METLTWLSFFFFPLLPAKIFPEGVQDRQLLQAYPAAAGESAGKFCLHRQQASESYLRGGQQGVCGESAASIWASWKDRQAPAAGAERVAGGGGRTSSWKRGHGVRQALANNPAGQGPAAKNLMENTAHKLHPALTHHTRTYGSASLRWGTSSAGEFRASHHPAAGTLVPAHALR